MSDKENELLECDALPVVVRNASNQIANTTNTTNNVINNNMLVSAQSTTSTNLNFENCNGVTIGNVMQFLNPGALSRSSNAVSRLRQEEMEEAIVYRKTPTVKKMMECEKPLNERYLDIFCGHFGDRWRAIPVLLEINELFVQRMIEDHFNRGGVQEVIFQVLYDYFQNNQDKATVGWFTTFLYRNGFRKTLFTVKEHWKLLKQLDQDDSEV